MNDSGVSVPEEAAVSLPSASTVIVAKLEVPGVTDVLTSSFGPIVLASICQLVPLPLTMMSPLSPSLIPVEEPAPV